MLRCIYIVAEAQLGHTLRRAADLLAEATPALTVSLQGYTIDELLHVPIEQLRADIAQADVLIGSMLNSDAEVTRLQQLLNEHRPPVTLFFTSQPELTQLTRIGSFDALKTMNDRATLMQLVAKLQAAGAPMPPIPHAILAATPRLSQRFGPEVLGDLWTYGRAGSYWLNSSPDNVAQMLLHVATQLPGHGGQWQPQAPEVYPTVALWHPAAEDYFQSYEAYARWYEQYRLAHRGTGPATERGAVVDAEQAGDDSRPRVGVVVFRQYVTGGTFEHYAAAIAALEAEGLDVVCGFGGMDNSALVRDFFEPADIQLLLNLTGFNLVGSMGRPQPDEAVSILKELNIPYLVPFPLLFQTAGQWHADPIGLAPMQSALQVVLPELEGATEPRVFATKGDDDNFAPNARQLSALARRGRRHVDLRTKPVQHKRVALTIFSFPPDKGSVGSAAYLDVFETVYNLLVKLRAQGYTVALPEDVESLQQLVLGGDQALPGSPTVAVADTLPTQRYRELTPSLQRIEANFGPAPGLIDTDSTGLHIKGRAFGNVFVGVQPGFGYEGDPMRLLFAKDASPSHSFAAYYAWLRHVWQADAVVHVGTHGALEFMPGKQVGMTADCYPDALVGDLPHVYFYSMNNPSEATIAKRRSYATMVTYLSPPLREAGLYRTLLALNEALGAYRETAAATAAVAAASAEPLASTTSIDPSPRLDDAFATVRSLAEQTNLDTDVPPPQPGELRDAYIGRLTAYVQTLAERLIPVGLHVAGQPVTDTEAAEFLWAALQHPRPDENMPGLPQWVAAQRGLAWGELEAGDPLRDEVVAAARRAVDELVQEDPDAGSENADADEGQQPAGSVGADAEWQHIAAFARDFLARLRHDGELDALVTGLNGGYIEPAPGGDPARVPAALPTGRNLHALDPQRIPSPAARQQAQPVVERLLERIVDQDGAYPETIACVLWGTDNIKTQGEGVAQALELIGVEPVADSLGRMTRLRLIPLEELGRPRIDVVLSVSGIFRDIFPNVMELLDRAVQLAAAAPEDVEQNYVRKHALAIAEQLDVPFEDAARRVFSNAPGAYGTGVNNVVEASTWETDGDLADVFIERKAYAFGTDGAVHSPELLEACLQTCSATFQNLDSTEIGLSDVDHYFEYLGGLAVATKSVRGATPAAFVADTLSPDMAVRSLEETLRLETRTRLLNPRWYEGMLAHGYQGVHEIATRLDNTFGWSATANAVDEWIYTAAADTFVLDDALRERMTEYNPRAVQRMAERLAEAHERGFWQGDEERLTKLRQVVMQTEDLLEGVV